jgi:hypothetical protein
MSHYKMTINCTSPLLFRAQHFFTSALMMGACLFVTSCATSYQPQNGNRNGYSETRVAENRFLVRFDANSNTTKNRAYDYLLRRNSELCASIGYRYFSILNQKDNTDARVVQFVDDPFFYGPEFGYYGGYHGRYRGRPYGGYRRSMHDDFFIGSSFGAPYGGHTTTEIIESPHFVNEIECRHTTQGSGKIYDGTLIINDMNNRGL